ncbi:MAG TPA: ABC transporter ATP-binding protein [Bryobacteraceae bacterium]|jgi:ABC-2 type transport system ATP-binding protein
MKYQIEIDQLRKNFGEQTALDGLTLSVPEGSIYGFLGRNGAGKTTTIKMLMGMLRPDSGRARVFGVSAADAHRSIEIRQRTGYVTEDKALFPYMSVGQIIRFTRSFFPRWRDDLEQRYLKMFQLPPDARIPELSTGTRTKVMLLLALCRGADLLILDEPTSGLDPAAIEQVLQELVALAASEGTTIFFSSHQLSEVEQIADHIAIVDAGRTLISGALDDMKARYQRLQVVFEQELLAPVPWVEGVEHVRQEGRMVSLLASGNIEGIVAQAESLHVTSVERFPVSLKEIFLEHIRSN